MKTPDFPPAAPAAPSQAPSISLAAAYPDPAAAPHLAGWQRTGAPVYHGTQGEWSQRIKDACRKMERKP
jgi:hypothetical protein